MTSFGSSRHWTAFLVEVGVGAEGALRDELLPARGALLVARSQRRDDAFGAKPEVRGNRVSQDVSLLTTFKRSVTNLCPHFHESTEHLKFGNSSKVT